MMGNPFAQGVANEAPDCSLASPSLTMLWPANHAMISVTLAGVTDPDGDPVMVTVLEISQDEPVNERGDGNSGPDGAGIGTSTALLRAERSGARNGRVYHVTFLVEDDKGEACVAGVTVTVPHSQGSKGAAVDDGPLYDSTVP
jgi:hypothetical protein